MNDDIGTVRWFGESWHAPVNRPRAAVDPPLGEPCFRCRELFEPGDQGITIPMVSGVLVETVGYHLDCWLAEIGAPPRNLH